MRLIDADELIKRINGITYAAPTITTDQHALQIFGAFIVADILQVIREHPTAYDVDKVLDELCSIRRDTLDELCKISPPNGMKYTTGECDGLTKAIEVVEGGRYETN